jgi:hypothetical protein
MPSTAATTIECGAPKCSTNGCSSAYTGRLAGWRCAVLTIINTAAGLRGDAVVAYRELQYETVMFRSDPRSLRVVYRHHLDTSLDSIYAPRRWTADQPPRLQVRGCHGFRL